MVALVAVACGEAAATPPPGPDSVDLLIRQSPSPFQQVSAGPVSALIPDEWYPRLAGPIDDPRQRPDIFCVERTEIDHRGQPVSSEPVDRGREQRRARQVGSGGRDERHGIALQAPNEQREHRERVRVGGMQVVDGEHDRLDLGELA